MKGGDESEAGDTYNHPDERRNSLATTIEFCHPVDLSQYCSLPTICSTYFACRGPWDNEEDRGDW